MNECEGFYGPCGAPGVRRRQNTAYVNDDDNYRCLCEQCQADADEYWEDAWAEYRSMTYGA